MGMVDSQSCSSSNRTRLDGTGDEKEGEVRSFGGPTLDPIFIAGQVETLLG